MLYFYNGIYIESDQVMPGKRIAEDKADKIRAKTQPGPQDTIADLMSRMAKLEKANKPTTPQP